MKEVVYTANYLGNDWKMHNSRETFSVSLETFPKAEKFFAGILFKCLKRRMAREVKKHFFTHNKGFDGAFVSVRDGYLEILKKRAEPTMCGGVVEYELRIEIKDV